MTTGTGLPGVDRTTFVKSRVGMDYANFIPAPSGSLALKKTVAFSHRIMLIVPLGK
jgi:hypothetical protein